MLKGRRGWYTLGLRGVHLRWDIDLVGGGGESLDDFGVSATGCVRGGRCCSGLGRGGSLGGDLAYRCTNGSVRPRHRYGRATGACACNDPMEHVEYSRCLEESELLAESVAEGQKEG